MSRRPPSYPFSLEGRAEAGHRPAAAKLPAPQQPTPAEAASAASSSRAQPGYPAAGAAVAAAQPADAASEGHGSDSEPGEVRQLRESSTAETADAPDPLQQAQATEPEGDAVWPGAAAQETPSQVQPARPAASNQQARHGRQADRVPSSPARSAAPAAREQPADASVGPRYTPATIQIKPVGAPLLSPSSFWLRLLIRAASSSSWPS